MARAIGKAFPVSKKDVKGYGYAEPRRMKKNAGVTAIAAINGPGAYARARARSRSARQAMAGLPKTERLRHARNVTREGRQAFERRMRSTKTAKGATMRTNATQKQIAAARRNIRKAIAARRRAGGRRRTKNAWPGARKKRRTTKRRSATRSHRANRQTAAQRRAALRNLKKAHAARRRGKATKAKGRTRKPNRRRATTRRRYTSNRRQTPAQRRASPRNLKKARSASRRRHRRNAWPNDAAGHSRAAKKGWRRKKRRSTKKGTKRKASRKRSMRKNASTAQRRAARRNIKKAQAAWRRMHKTGGRRRTTRRLRKNAGRRTAAKRRTRRRTASRRRGRMRPNAARSRYTGNAKAFRKNQYMETMKAAFANGALITAGFAAHKALTAAVCKLVCERLFGAPATVEAPAEPPATAGLEVLQPYQSTIAGALTAALGIGITNMVVKDVRVKMMVTGGIATSFLHTVLVAVLDRVSPDAATALSGRDDTAAKLSAMYGLGAGTSILPHYRPIGEYFTEQVSGMGEYFTENVSGLGQYTPNPDLYQAAAGYGAVDHANTNHIDPSSDLDRELSIAEAAAGVGHAYQAAAGMGDVEPFEASAGIGEYFTEQVSGLGAIATLPTADTWIPGTSDGQLWAGVRPIAQPQSSHAMTRAGILTSGGNQGVFG